MLLVPGASLCDGFVEQPRRSNGDFAVKIMRTAVILLAVGPLSGIDARPSGAETYRPWCVVYNGRDGPHLHLQLVRTVHDDAPPGTGGSCVQNPWYAANGPNSPGSPSTTTGQGKRAKR